MTTAAASLHVPSLVDVLYTATRDRILTGELPAGSPLTEMEVATLYSVARPTAKAAMERLVYDGLLRRASNKTARVPEMGVDDIRDLYFSRGLLEREVMVELARRKHVPEAARRSLRAMREAGRDSVSSGASTFFGSTPETTSMGTREPNCRAPSSSSRVVSGRCSMVRNEEGATILIRSPSFVKEQERSACCSILCL